MISRFSLIMLAGCSRALWERLKLLKKLSNQKKEMLVYKSQLRFWEVVFELVISTFSRIVAEFLQNDRCVLSSWNSFLFREEYLLPDLFHLGLTGAALHFGAHVSN